MDSILKSMKNLDVNQAEHANLSFNDLKHKWEQVLVKRGMTQNIEQEAKRLAEREMLDIVERTRSRVVKRLKEDVAQSITPEERELKCRAEEVKRNQELRKRKIEDMMQQENVMNMMNKLDINKTPVVQRRVETRDDVVDMDIDVQDPTKRRNIRGGAKKSTKKPKSKAYSLFRFL